MYIISKRLFGLSEEQKEDIKKIIEESKLSIKAKYFLNQILNFDLPGDGLPCGLNPVLVFGFDGQYENHRMGNFFLRPAIDIVYSNNLEKAKAFLKSEIISPEAKTDSILCTARIDLDDVPFIFQGLKKYKKIGKEE